MGPGLAGERLMAASPASLKATWLAAKTAGRFSRRLGGAFTSRLWFTPWPVPLSERARAKQAGWIQATEPVSFPVEGREIAGFAAGRGPTVLLVHGWGERAGTLGGFVQPLVDAGFRVVGIDLPGHGATDPRGRQTDILTQTRSLRSVARQLGGIDAVIAHSMGGCVASVALKEGLDVRALVLLAPATNVDHMMDKFAEMFSLPSRSMEGLRASIERRFGVDVWARLDITRLARGFAQPVLIVHDRDDAQIDVSDSEVLAYAWKGSRTLITSGLGHDRITRDRRVIEEATAFLAEVIQHREVELVAAGASS